MLGFLAEILIEILGDRVLLRAGLELGDEGIEVLEVIVLEEGFTDAPLLLDVVAEREEEVIQGPRQPGEEVGLVAAFDLLGAAREFREERRINLRAAIVVGADVVEVGAVGQRVLGDERHVAPVVGRVHEVALAGGREALAEDHVGRIETSGIGAAVEHGVAVHLGIDQFALGRLHQFLAALGIVGELARRGILERRREHVVAEPVAEVVTALLVVRPVREDGPRRHGADDDQQWQLEQPRAAEKDDRHRCEGEH